MHILPETAQEHHPVVQISAEMRTGNYFAPVRRKEFLPNRQCPVFCKFLF